MKKIAVMTGGGDCPGLNAVIRAVVLSGLSYDFETLGLHNGWQGLIEGDLEPLTEVSVSGIISLGGTIQEPHGQIRSKNPAMWKRSGPQ
jgi:6-phosphofructokinase